MLEHIQACLPEEACGMLGGKGDVVQQVLPVTNAAHSPYRFRMEPAEQVQTMQRMEDEGMILVGIYHSHPSGPAGLSETDLAEAAYPEATYLVWWSGPGGWEFQAFDLGEGEVRQVLIDSCPRRTEDDLQD